MRSSRIQLRELTKTYGRFTAVDRLTLDIEPGQMVALLGPSGCGKTTCLRMVAGLLQPSSGGILVDGIDVTAVPVHRRNVGMLFQSYALFPHLTVAGNVAFGLEMRKLRRAEVRRRVAGALDLVQLGAMAGRMPAQLSGGQQQRVGLARALVIEPAMLLLDEPLGALDKNLREEMQAELRGLQHRLGLTTIMVTHDQDEALTMADQVVVMRDGRVEQAGTPAAVYAHPSSRFVAGFLGTSNTFQGIVETREGRPHLRMDRGWSVALPGAHPPGSRVTAIVRPEAILLGPAEPGAAVNEVAAHVEQATYHGATIRYRLLTATGEHLVAMAQNGGGARPVDGPVTVRWAVGSMHVLPRDD